VFGCRKKTWEMFVLIEIGIRFLFGAGELAWWEALRTVECEKR